MPMRLLERIELFMYRHCSAVVSVSRSFISNLLSRGIDASKMAFVPNGVEMSYWGAGSRERGRAALGVDDNAIVASYVGTVGMAHDVGGILRAAALLRDELPHLRFFVIGDGAELPRLRDQAASDGLLDRVTFTGLVPRESVPDLLAASDVALVTLKRADVFTTVLPSKMFEAMAAARPIVLAVEGEARDTLRQSGGGLASPPGDPVALADAIARLARDGALRARRGAAGSRFVEHQFGRAAWAARYLDILERTARAGDAFTAEPQPRTSPLS
jgi:glycosyltransferase involved in cell wall biosynthesis